MSSLPIHVKYKNVKTICGTYFWQFSNWFKFLLLEVVIIQAKSWDFCTTALTFGLLTHNTSQRTFSHILPYRKATGQFLSDVSPTLTIFLLLLNRNFGRFTFTLIKKWNWLVKINVFHHPMGAEFCCSPVILMSSTGTDKSHPCRHSQFDTFSNPNHNRTSPNFLSHSNPDDGWPNFVQGLQCLSVILAICVVEDVHTRTFWLQNSEQSGRIFQLFRSSYYVGCQSDSPAMISITVAAVIWDANEPCSVNTARAPGSSVFSRWQMSINEATWTFVWCFQTDIFFCSSLGSIATLTTFRASLILCRCFRTQNFHRLRHRKNLCTKL